VEGDVALGNFSDTERGLLVCLPRWVVAAASAVERDNATRTHREVEAGFLAVANGRQVGNAFVSEVATRTLDIFDEDRAHDGITTDTEAGIDNVLERARSAWELLRAKAAPGDAAAYGRWLLAVTDEVITAARSDGLLGVGGAVVTKAEQNFRDRLAQILT
jgi:hypothetical protein